MVLPSIWLMNGMSQSSRLQNLSAWLFINPRKLRAKASMSNTVCSAKREPMGPSDDMIVTCSVARNSGVHARSAPVAAN